MSKISVDIFRGSVNDKLAAFGRDDDLNPAQASLLAGGIVGTAGLMAIGGHRLWKSRKIRKLAESYGRKVAEIEKAMPKVSVKNMWGHPDSLWIESTRTSAPLFGGKYEWRGWPVYFDTKEPISTSSLRDLRDYVKSLQGELAQNSRHAELNAAEAKQIRLSAVKHLLGGLTTAGATGAGMYLLDR